MHALMGALLMKHDAAHRPIRKAIPLTQTPVMPTLMASGFGLLIALALAMRAVLGLGS